MRMFRVKVGLTILALVVIFIAMVIGERDTGIVIALVLLGLSVVLPARP